MLMVPPMGYKFIPRNPTVCGQPGCFECYDIFCERCESKDRRIVELEMRNNDLVKYITKLQSRLFQKGSVFAKAPSPSQTMPPSLPQMPDSPNPHIQVTGDPFAYIQSPVLFDPKLNLSYVATTLFCPAAVDNSDSNSEYFES
eukprot:Platyproteum_vivax@DN11141_c0_g1_i1.p1